MRRFNYKTIFHVLFGLFLIALPFSKGIHSVAYVGLLLLSLGGVFIRKANIIRRGGRVVMQQIANLSTLTGRQGSSPCLSAIFVRY